MHAYGHGLDFGLRELFADCWTRDAEASYNFDAANRSTPTGKRNLAYSGREELLGFYDMVREGLEGQSRKHMLV